jgi:hypothetical protein
MGGSHYEFTELPKNSKISIGFELWGTKSKQLRYVCIDMNRVFEQEGVKDQVSALKEDVCLDITKTLTEEEFEARMTKILETRLSNR